MDWYILIWGHAGLASADQDMTHNTTPGSRAFAQKRTLKG